MPRARTRLASVAAWRVLALLAVRNASRPEDGIGRHKSPSQTQAKSPASWWRRLDMGTPEAAAFPVQVDAGRRVANARDQGGVGLVAIALGAASKGR
jgi:hypothetical protein